MPTGSSATSGPPGGPPLVFLLSKVGVEAGRSFHAALAPLGIEPAHFGVLNGIASEEGQTQQAVGSTLHVAPSRMVALLDALEERGLVERRVHPDDRRARALHLTRRGRTVLDDARARALGHEAELVERLSPEERTRLRSILVKLAAEQDLPLHVHPGLARG